MNSAPTDLGSRWAGFQSDIHENVYRIFSRSLPLCGQRCSVIFKTILEAKLVDAEECPTCGGVGFVTPVSYTHLFATEIVVGFSSKTALASPRDLTARVALSEDA